MGIATGNTTKQYVLVIKDDASKYVWFPSTKSADSLDAVDGLFAWFAAFSISRRWVSDQGTNSKCVIIAELQRALGAVHRFTTPHCHWANGSIECVMRHLLKCTRALLSEWRLPPHDWERILPIVQLVLNNSSSPSIVKLHLSRQ